MKNIRALLVLSLGLQAAPLPYLSEQVQGTWICTEPDLCESHLQTWLHSHGGQLIQSGNQQMRLQIPLVQSDSLSLWLKTQGFYLQQNKTRQNLSPQLNEIESQIGFKEKAIQDFLTLLAQSNASSFSQVEEQLLSLNTELNELQLQKLRLLKQSKYADYSLQLSPRPKIQETPLQESSPFPWVRNLGFASLWNAFYDQPMEIDNETRP